MSREQQLIDLMFQVALTLSDNKLNCRKWDTATKADWIAEQLRAVGFDTTPCGCSWGILKEDK